MLQAEGTTSATALRQDCSEASAVKLSEPGGEWRGRKSEGHRPEHGGPHRRGRDFGFYSESSGSWTKGLGQRRDRI